MRSRRQSCLGSIVFRLGAGALFILGALILLWINEGRVDFGRIASDAVSVQLEQIDPDAEGELISVQGILEAETSLGDEPFLRPGPFIQIERHVESFVWHEKKRDGASSSSNANSGEKDPRDYDYILEWTDEPEDSSDFADPVGHENPPLTVSAETMQVAQASIGAYAVDPRSLQLPPGNELLLDNEKIIVGPNRAVDGKYLFEGQGTLSQPEVGDLRIWYEIVPDAIDVTIFGQQAGERIVPYLHSGENQLYRALALSPEAAVQKMSAEYRNLLWGLRFMGTFLMWGGLLLAASPLTNLLSWIPLVGSLGRVAVGVITFVLAVLLSVVVMIISYVAHTPILLVLILLVVGGGFYYLMKKRGVVEVPGDNLRSRIT